MTAAGEFRPIDLRRLVQPFARRWPLLAAAIVVPVVLVWTAAGELPPTYRASAQILLERDRVELGEIADVLTAPVISNSVTVSNEIAILLSTPVLEGAARRLGLLDARGKPVAAGLPAAEPSAVGRALTAVERWLAGFGLATAPPAAEPGAAAQVVDALRASLDVTRSLNASVIDVVATAPHASEAASVANAVVEEYLVAQQRTKREVTDRTLAWMRGEIEDLRARIAEQNRGIQAQRRQMLAAAVGDPATTENQLREVGNALAVARTEQADVESRLGELRAALAGTDVAAVGEVIDTPELAGVRRQLADLRQRLAAERASRGESRPVAAELQAQIASLTEDARALVAQVLDRLDLDRRIRAERIQALQRESTGLQQVALALEPAQVAITELEREAAASQQLYVVLLTRLNEITAQQESIAPDARVLNAAVPPEAPAGPRRGLYAALAGLAGFLGFTGAVLAADALTGRFESLGALEQATGVGVLAAIGRRGRPARVVDRDLGTLPAEDGVELALGAARVGGRLPARRAGSRGARLRRRRARGAARRGRRAAGAEDGGDRGGPRPGAGPAGDPPHRRGGRRRRRGGDRRRRGRMRRRAARASGAGGLGAGDRLGAAGRQLPRRRRRAAPGARAGAAAGRAAARGGRGAGRGGGGHRLTRRAGGAAQDQSITTLPEAPERIAAKPSAKSDTAMRWVISGETSRPDCTSAIILYQVSNISRP